MHMHLPATIANEADLAAHLEALLVRAPGLAEASGVAGPLPLRRISPDFAGLVWVIVGQQISVAAARAIHARLEAELGTLSADAMLAAPDEALRRAGLSIQKMRALRAAAAEVAGGLDLSTLSSLDAEEAIPTLCRIKGVGRWTAEVFLLFAVGHPDVFPAGDLAVQEAARLIHHLEERPKERDLRAMAESWRPHRGVAARLFWAYLGAVRSGRDSAPV
jgi:DNA-3-methyladenine glycosylase II